MDQVADPENQKKLAPTSKHNQTEMFSPGIFKVIMLDEQALDTFWQLIFSFIMLQI